uniref:Vitelline membrane outer layer protein 1 n=1 Tax=Leptobrachium leishanense TaxID=445787 RepID=A0A8C5M8X6_9ANUR
RIFSEAAHSAPVYAAYNSEGDGRLRFLVDPGIRWGRWGKVLQCKRGFLSGFALRVEEYLVLRDNTAANNIKFVCSDGNIIEGYGLRYGTYGIWSEKCRMGICGIQTQVQESQGPLDDTSLNNVRFLCCKNSPKGEDDQQQQTQ